jgi:hypothetical protein
MFLKISLLLASPTGDMVCFRDIPFLHILFLLRYFEAPDGDFGNVAFSSSSRPIVVLLTLFAGSFKAMVVGGDLESPRLLFAQCLHSLLETRNGTKIASYNLEMGLIACYFTRDGLFMLWNPRD